MLIGSNVSLIKPEHSVKHLVHNQVHDSSIYYRASNKFTHKDRNSLDFTRILQMGAHDLTHLSGKN